MDHYSFIRERLPMVCQINLEALIDLRSFLKIYSKKLGDVSKSMEQYRQLQALLNFGDRMLARHETHLQSLLKECETLDTESQQRSRSFLNHMNETERSLYMLLSDVRRLGAELRYAVEEVKDFENLFGGFTEGLAEREDALCDRVSRAKKFLEHNKELFYGCGPDQTDCYICAAPPPPPPPQPQKAANPPPAPSAQSLPKLSSAPSFKGNPREEEIKRERQARETFISYKREESERVAVERELAKRHEEVWASESQDPPAPKKKPLFGFLSKKKKENKEEIAPPTMDSVQFSAVVPESVRQDEYLTLDIFMYEDAFRKVVDEALNTTGPKKRETRSGYHKVARESYVRVLLSSPDIPADEEEECVWTGKYVSFRFCVPIPADYAKSQILLCAAVYINGLPATRLKLVVDCKAAARRTVSLSREDVLKAFVSYASPDRARVAAVIQGMEKARPDLDLFFDVNTLRSGQDWEERLQVEIDERDVLYLCWSNNAMQSEWVDKEWRYAYATKGVECIEPIPLDPPEKCPPPVELQKKHFNDRLLYIIKAAEADQR